MKNILPVFWLFFFVTNTHFYGQEVTNANWEAHFAYTDFVDVVTSAENVVKK